LGLGLGLGFVAGGPFPLDLEPGVTGFGLLFDTGTGLGSGVGVDVGGPFPLDFAPGVTGFDFGGDVGVVFAVVADGDVATPSQLRRHAQARGIGGAYQTLARGRRVRARRRRRSRVRRADSLVRTRHGER